MSFSTAWDESKPAGGRQVRLGDDDIREFKTQVRERFAVDHDQDAADSTTTGYHKRVTMKEIASDEAQLANAFVLYGKEVGGYTELYSRHENGSPQQLTLLGKLWIEALSIASVAQGDILYYDGTKFTRLGPGTSGQFLKTLGAAANPAWGDIAFQTAATQAEMEAASSVTVPVTPGRVKFHPGVAKGWIRFDGTGTNPITATCSNGLSGTVAKSSTGVYVITWATAFSAADAYMGVVSCNASNFGGVTAYGVSTTTITTWNSEGAVVDASLVSLVVFGDN